MPSRAKKLERDVARLPSIPKELVNQFLTGPMTGEAMMMIRARFVSSDSDRLQTHPKDT